MNAICRTLYLISLFALTGCTDSTSLSDVNAPEAAVPGLTESSQITDNTQASVDVDGQVGGGTVYDLSISLFTTPDPVTHLRYVLFEYEAADAVGYECQLDNTGFIPCDGSYFNESVAIGQHYFGVRAIGPEGYRGETLQFQWVVENLFGKERQDLIATNKMPDAVDPNSWRGIFRINCDFSHSSYNDPIVYPGRENAAHLHRFYGNTLVDHNTTVQSLYMTGESSCQGNKLNLSSYWIPALLAPDYSELTGDRKLDANGDPAWRVVKAVVGDDDVAHEIFYYSAGVDDLQSIGAIPPGLKMIAGDHGGRPGAEQSTAIARWHCQSWGSDDATNPTFSSSIPECVAPDRVRMDLFFPSCWNGLDLDSVDHQSHMAYPVSEGTPRVTRCPESHPHPIVRPSYHYAFGVTPDVYHPESKASSGWRLAADMYEVSEGTPGGMSLHGDWINGWHPDAMQAILENCIQSELDCHDGNLANGYRLSGTQPGTQNEPEIVDKGMGY